MSQHDGIWLGVGMGRDINFWSFKQIYLNQRSEPMWSIIWNIPSFLENHLLSLFWNEALWCSYQTWHDAAWNDKRIEWNDVICRFCSCGAIFFRSTESRSSVLYIEPLPYYRPASFKFHFLDLSCYFLMKYDVSSPMAGCKWLVTSRNYMC